MYLCYSTVYHVHGSAKHARDVFARDLLQTVKDYYKKMDSTQNVTQYFMTAMDSVKETFDV